MNKTDYVWATVLVVFIVSVFGVIGFGGYTAAKNYQNRFNLCIERGMQFVEGHCFK